MEECKNNTITEQDIKVVAAIFLHKQLCISFKQKLSQNTRDLCIYIYISLIEILFVLNLF